MENGKNIFSDFLAKCLELVATYGGKLLLAILVLIIGSIVVKALNKAITKALNKTKVDEVLKKILIKTVKFILNVILIIAIILSISVLLLAFSNSAYRRNVREAAEQRLESIELPRERYAPYLEKTLK